MVKPSTQPLNAFTTKPDTSEWVKKQELTQKKKKGGIARAKNTDGDALTLKFGKTKKVNND